MSSRSITPSPYDSVVFDEDTEEEKDPVEQYLEKYGIEYAVSCFNAKTYTGGKKPHMKLFEQPGVFQEKLYAFIKSLLEKENTVQATQPQITKSNKRKREDEDIFQPILSNDELLEDTDTEMTPVESNIIDLTIPETRGPGWVYDTNLNCIIIS